MASASCPSANASGEALRYRTIGPCVSQLPKILATTSSAPTVVANQLVQLTGTVAEYNTGAASNALTASRPITQLTNMSGLSTLASNQAVAPTPLTLPATQDELEALEGMLVQVTNTLTSSQNSFQGRYGQVTLSADGRLVKPLSLIHI